MAREHTLVYNMNKLKVLHSMALQQTYIIIQKKSSTISSLLHYNNKLHYL
jgi:hypothetical protein